MSMKKRALGRGLDALMGISAAAHESPLPITSQSPSDLRRLPIEFIVPNAQQPRRQFDDASLEELAASIRAQGIVQPIVVRPQAQGRYEIIAGERRWRAAQKAGLAEVPAIIKSVSNEMVLAVALIENIQREDLHPLEEADALQRLLNDCQMTHEQIGGVLGKSRESVSNLLRLLALPDDVKTLFMQYQINMGHARAILTLPAEKQLFVANKIAQQKLSVRETELLVRRLQNPTENKTPQKSVPADIRQLQEELSAKLGAVVSVQHGVRGRGKLVITYNSLDELDGILAHIH